jgi:aryl-alcohol dehydrogenase-like predicted oxidoreductase
MEYVRLGGTGLKVSRLCLGTMTFGLQCDEPGSFAIMDRAAEGGISFFDTADAYPLGGNFETAGRTEEIIGRWLKGKRDDFIIATKCFVPMGPRPFQGGNNRRHMMNAVEASLRRLGTDYIDLYQVHMHDPSTPVDETLETMDALIKSGKVRYVGCSNHLAYQLARALGRSEARSLAKYVSVQPRYNLLYREIERELIPLCLEEQVAVIPYNPIAGGMLSGKHDRSKPPTEGTRFTAPSYAGTLYRQRYWQDHVFDTVDAIAAVAKDAGLAMPTLALAWVLAQPGITSPIVGASRPDQLDATLGALEVKLDEGVLSRLAELTHEFRRGDSAR